MGDFIGRILDALAARLFGQAERLVRLSAARHLVDEYRAAYDDATVLETSGKKRLAAFLRSELDEALDGSAAVTSAVPAEAMPLSLNGAGDRGPFVALSGPGPAVAVSESAATPAVAMKEPTAKRRGRPRKASSGRKSKRQTKREAAAVETIESTSLQGD